MTNNIRKMTSSILCQHSVVVNKCSVKVEILYENYVLTIFHWHKPKAVNLNIQFINEKYQPEIYKEPECFIDIDTNRGNYIFSYPHAKRQIMFEDYECIREALKPFMADKDKQ